MNYPLRKIVATWRNPLYPHEQVERFSCGHERRVNLSDVAKSRHCWQCPPVQPKPEKQTGQMTLPMEGED